MRDGIYRLRYQTASLSATGVITLNDGALSGCDRYFFMFGDYHQSGNAINGTVTFKRHTGTPSTGIPQQFKLVFDGVGSDSFGQFDARFAENPDLKVKATFQWMCEF